MRSIMRTFCMGCWQPLPVPHPTPLGPHKDHVLCPTCVRQLWDLRIPSALADTHNARPGALYAYDRLVRSLIWRAKIKDDLRALDLLLLLGTCTQAVSTAQWADLIVPAPSSLWGRARGRLDIAAHFSQHLAREAQKPLIPAPWTLHWRLKKRAQTSWSERQRDVPWRLPLKLRETALLQWARACQSAIPAPPARVLRILVVDDVITTGSTLRIVGQAITQACALAGFPSHLRFLAFAKACL